MRLRGVRLVDLSLAGSLPAPTGLTPGRSLPSVSGPIVDIEIRNGRIAEVSSGSRWNGTWVLPGLWDHHVHMTEWARRSHRLDLSPCTSPREVLDHVAAAAASQEFGTDRLVGTGLWHSRWDTPFNTPGGPLRADLDAVTGDLPTVLISADLHSAWFNTAAAHRFGLTTGPAALASGLVAEEEWFARMPEVGRIGDDVDDAWVGEAATRAASRGVVGIVDFEFQDTVAAWRRRVASGFSTLRVGAAVWPEHLDSAISSGYRTGAAILGEADPAELVTMGPLKIISDGSLNTRTAWCHDPYPDGSVGAANLAPAELRELMARAHSAGIESAIHAIGDRANSTALDAFEAVGAQGSIEHAQLLSDGDVPRFRRLGIRASVQPAHLIDDRDTAESLWAGRTGRAYRFAELHRAGVELTFGSDAPVAPLDPWLALRAACARTGDTRPAWHGEQILDRAAALRASVAAPAVVPGGPADLIVLGADPLSVPAGDLTETPVLQTICAGAVTHEA